MPPTATSSSGSTATAGPTASPVAPNRSRWPEGMPMRSLAKHLIPREDNPRADGRSHRAPGGVGRCLSGTPGARWCAGPGPSSSSCLAHAFPIIQHPVCHFVGLGPAQRVDCHGDRSRGHAVADHDGPAHGTGRHCRSCRRGQGLPGSGPTLPRERRVGKRLGSAGWLQNGEPLRSGRCGLVLVSGAEGELLIGRCRQRHCRGQMQCIKCA